MEDMRIILAGIWIALMLTYLLGDVMRIFAGDFTSGELGGMEISQSMLMLMALIMLIPIIMILLSLTLTFPIIRWVTIIAAIYINLTHSCYIFLISPRSFFTLFPAFLLLPNLRSSSFLSAFASRHDKITPLLYIFDAIWDSII